MGHSWEVFVPSTERLATEAIETTGTGVADLSARGACRELLSQAVGLLAGRDGAVYMTDGSRDVQLVATWGEPRSRPTGHLQESVRRALASERPVLSAVDDQNGQPDGQAEHYLAVPLEVSGETVGVLAITGIPRVQAPAEIELGRLAQTSQMLALSLERFRLLAALDRRGEEVEALRRQLDAFAVDFRSTYQAERDRSQQLSVALAELGRTYKSTVRALAMAVEAKDECTGGHLHRVSRFGMLLTALVAPEHAEDPQFEYGFLLHDIGKLMVPDEVLNKPGPLSDAEWEVMREHPGKGRSILEGIDFLDVAREIVYHHHERWDGRGYPEGLRDMEIPLGARIFPLCDAFDAMTSDRPYRKAMPVYEALEQVRAGSGTQFWDRAVEAFFSVPVAELEAIAAYGKSPS